MGIFKYFKKKKLIEEGQAFLDKVIAEKKLNVISPTINLQKSEKAFYEGEVKMKESRKKRGYTELQEIDSGRLVLTNKRLIFDGNTDNRFIKLDKILSVQSWLDAIEISIDGRAKSIFFLVNNPYIWAVLINIVQKVENPENLEGIDINIRIQ